MLFKSYEPRRMTKGSAGYDFFSPNEYDLEPGKWTTIDTEVSLTNDDRCLNFGSWVMLIFPRSGLSNRYGLRIRNTVGVVDMDYRDTIKCTVTVDEPYTIKVGERFIQGVIVPFGTFDDEIKPIKDRIGGFGSTGI